MEKGGMNNSPFVILHTARCGSHYLASILNNHPNIKCLGEILNSRILDEHDNRPWADILSEIKNSEKQVGFLLPVGIVPYIEEEITNWVQSVPIKILLYRENDLERYLSYKLALENEVWVESDIPKKYEKKKAEFYLKELLLQVVEQRRRIKIGEGLNPDITLNYEELTTSTEKSIGRILNLLRQPKDLLEIKKVTTKQNPEAPKEKVTNPNALDAPEVIHALKNLNKTIDIPIFEEGKFKNLLEEGTAYMREDLTELWKTPLMELEWSTIPKSDGSNWEEIIKTPLKEVVIKEPSGKLRKLSFGRPEYTLLKYIAVLLLKRLKTNYNISSQHGTLTHQPPNLLLSTSWRSKTNDVPSEWEAAGYRMDIKSCFSSITPDAVVKAIHEKLKTLSVEEKIGLELLQKIFSAERETTTQTGIVTGDPTGIFWANVVLEGIDTTLSSSGVRFVRIVDDIAVDATYYYKTVVAVIQLSEWLKTNNLQANLDKTGFESPLVS
jgi:hypothetical protein